MNCHRHVCFNRTFHIDIVGSGPEEAAIKKAVHQRDLPVTFHGAMDHAKLTKYKVSLRGSPCLLKCGGV